MPQALRFFFLLFCFIQISFADIPTLKIYGKTYHNPKAGKIVFPPLTGSHWPAIFNDLKRDVSVYNNNKCSGKAVDKIPKDRATIDFKGQWGGCLIVH
ncbi:hypothetical protein BD408DRAFT_408907 [Parasitella parasitica]|nr:hypothetical protein BD408DRAFT_408907 [Parasitella parasitica]